ncbi:MAG: hypothetical protein ABR955_11175 [Verrucomicrobiota bacterium]|jgi:hypothetical protein
MNNVPAYVRSFITFAVIVPLALVFGYLMTGPLDVSTLAVIGIVAAILIFPLLLRWHYPLLLLCWNLAAIAFFLPGSPSVCLVMIALSLGISVLQRMISKESQFIIVPQIIFPLLCLLAVIVVTAKFTGLGLRSFGGEVYGGRKYVYLLGGILGYFALSAYRIPLERRNLYLGLFFLGGLTAFIGDLFPWLPHWTYFIYDFFTYNQYYFGTNTLEGESVRFTGAVATSLAVFTFMLARYGIRGVFLAGKPWRWVILIVFVMYSLLGGFRSIVVLFGLIFAILFLLERLYRTRLMPVFLLVGIVGGLALIPLASHLPYTIQRSLSFLPLNIDPMARADAEDSEQWRIKMWQGLLPQVPRYLLLGKGYVISPLDYQFVMGPQASVQNTFAEDQGLALAEDYHSGPLSVVIPLGIWGAIAFLWFLIAGVRVVYANYHYGDPALNTANSFLLAAFVAQIIFFLFVFGDLSNDMLKFCGLLGLSVSLNGGMCRPARAREIARQPEPPKDFRRFFPPPAPAFQRRIG